MPDNPKDIADRMAGETARDAGGGEKVVAGYPDKMLRPAARPKLGLFPQRGYEASARRMKRWTQTKDGGNEQ